MRAPRRHARSSAGLLLVAAAVVLVSLLAGGRGSSAFAQTEEGAGWTRLAREADVIVLGECAEESARWDDGLITTTIQFRPYRFYKGDPTRALTVKTLGGRVGDDSMAASHGAGLAAGEQVLLFLKRSEFGPYFVIVGGDAGKRTIPGLPAHDGNAPTMGTRAELRRLLNRGLEAQ